MNAIPAATIAADAKPAPYAVRAVERSASRAPAGAAASSPARSPDVTCAASSRTASIAKPVLVAPATNRSRATSERMRDQRRDTDKDADEARRTGEAGSHTGAILGYRALQDLHGLPVEEPSTTARDHHGDEEHPISYVRSANQPERGIAHNGDRQSRPKQRPAGKRVASRRVIRGASTIGRAKGIIAIPADSGSKP